MSYRKLAKLFIFHVLLLTVCGVVIHLGTSKLFLSFVPLLLSIIYGLIKGFIYVKNYDAKR